MTHFNNPDKSTSIETRVYGERKVFIFKNHEVALKPWAEVRRTLSMPPLLFTIDHHTDTREAFRQATYKAVASIIVNEDKLFAERARLIDTIVFSNPGTVEAAVRLLNWDEHIDAGIESKILDAAVVLAHNSQFATWPIERQEEKKFRFAWADSGKSVPLRPHHYEEPCDRIFYLPNEDGDKPPLVDRAIETDFLDEKMGHVTEMLASLGRQALEREPYIFDIDLDYFLTPKSLQPDDPSRFHSLLRSAVAVTIALEPGCVQNASNGKVTAETALAAIETHLVNALGPRQTEPT